MRTSICLGAMAILLAGLVTLPRTSNATPEDDLQQVWDRARPLLGNYLERGSQEKGAIDGGGLAGGSPYPLYNVQLYTQPLLIWLKDQPRGSEQAQAMTDELAEIYLVPFSFLKQTSEEGSKTKYRGWTAGADDARFAKQYRGHETLLYSVQYLYAVSQLIRLIAVLPPAERTANEQALLKKAPYIAECYARWLSGDRKDEVQAGELPSTTPISDKSMQAAAGMLELLLAMADRPRDFTKIPATQRKPMHRFVDSFWLRFGSRMQEHPDGTITWDEAWGTNPAFNSDYFAAGYTDPASPPAHKTDCPPLTHLSYDLSHNIRLIWTLDSYSRQPGTRAQAQRFTRGLAQHFVKQVWNGDMAAPRFANYFSGDEVNGWYAVQFDAQGDYVKGTGLKPGGLGALAGPYYFLWSASSPELAKLADAYREQNPAIYSGHGDWPEVFRALSLLPCLPEYRVQTAGN